jgi:hypothetical protein
MTTTPCCDGFPTGETMRTTLVLAIDVTYTEDDFQAVVERVTIVGTDYILPPEALSLGVRHELSQEAQEHMESSRDGEWEERRRRAIEAEMRARNVDWAGVVR